MIEVFGAGYLLKQINNLFKQLSGLKAADQKVVDDISKIKNQLKGHQKRLEKGEKVLDSQAREIAELQQQVQQLGSSNHGLRVRLGKTKKENQRLLGKH